MFVFACGAGSSCLRLAVAKNALLADDALKSFGEVEPALSRMPVVAMLEIATRAFVWQSVSQTAMFLFSAD